MNAQNRKFLFYSTVLMFWLTALGFCAYRCSFHFKKECWYGAIIYFMYMVYAIIKAERAKEKINETFKQN